MQDFEKKRMQQVIKACSVMHNLNEPELSLPQQPCLLNAMFTTFRFLSQRFLEFAWGWMDSIISLKACFKRQFEKRALIWNASNLMKFACS